MALILLALVDAAPVAGSSAPLVVPADLTLGYGVVEGNPIAVRESGRPDLTNVLWAVGDIGQCGSDTMDDQVGAMLATTTGAIATLGDTAYPDASAQNFAECFDPAWRPVKSRIFPALGNHEYHQPGAKAYFDYFGAAAGDRTKGYYSYDVATWHIVVLNSLCDQVGGCGPGSPQAVWLAADLAAHPTKCSAAYWHYPLFSSGHHGSISAMHDLWQILIDHGADVVFNGHDHSYERFAPQTAGGVADPAHGIREFVVGTGGVGFYEFHTPLANSEVRDNNTAGALKLTLADASYTWQFFKAAGPGTLADSGTGTCH